MAARELAEALANFSLAQPQAEEHATVHACRHMVEAHDVLLASTVTAVEQTLQHRLARPLDRMLRAHDAVKQRVDGQRKAQKECEAMHKRLEQARRAGDPVEAQRRGERLVALQLQLHEGTQALQQQLDTMERSRTAAVAPVAASLAMCQVRPTRPPDCHAAACHA